MKRIEAPLLQAGGNSLAVAVQFMKSANKPRIIFLTEPLNSPSTRFRVLQNILEFKKLNFDTTVEVIPKKIPARIKLFHSLPSYDIVFLQRRLLQWWTLWYIRRKSKVLIYDFDDAVLFRDSNASDFYSFSRLKRFKHSLKFSNLVIVGNEYLKKLSLPYSDNVYVIPTGIDMQTYVPGPSRSSSGPLTIGWIGSAPNLFYLKQIREAINELYQLTKSFKLKIVCDDFIEGFKCPVEKKIWKEEEEVKDIQSFDIGIFPLEEDLWTKGKCALKLLQYMSCGIASVSSTSEVTSSIIRDGINGFLASNPGQWIKKIKILLDHPDRLKPMGLKARKSLKGTYDTKTIATKYARLFLDSGKS